MYTAKAASPLCSPCLLSSSLVFTLLPYCWKSVCKRRRLNCRASFVAPWVAFESERIITHSVALFVVDYAQMWVDVWFFFCFLFSPATVIHIVFSQHFIADRISRGCAFTGCFHERVSKSFRQRYGNWLTANDGEQLRNVETLHVNSWQIVVFIHYDLNWDAFLSHSRLSTKVPLIVAHNYLQIAVFWHSIAVFTAKYNISLESNSTNFTSIHK